MPVNIAEVARRAGVSTATVSRVLSGKAYVSDDLRQRVLDAVERLNYRPSRVARTLRAQRSHTIGLIVSDIQNPFFTSVARAVEDTAYLQQYAVILCNSDEDAAKEAMYINIMISEQVAGVILAPTTNNSDAYQRLAEMNVPAVVIDRRVPGLDVDTVVVDNLSAARELVEHLISNGHQRIAAVVGPPASSTYEERLRGYQEALQAHRLPVDPELIRTGSPRVLTGHQMTYDLLKLPAPPTAIFTGNNLLTIGALRAIHEKGLRIPDDIALAAFDEMDWMFFLTPALTVVAQPTYNLGQVAVDLLLQRLDSPLRPRQEIVLTPALHIRESSIGRSLNTVPRA